MRLRTDLPLRLLALAPLAAPAAGQESALELHSLAERVPAPAGAPRFERLDAAGAGVDFEGHVDWDHPLARLYPHAYAGGGVALGDLDGNGLPDLYLTGQAGDSRLYLQRERWRFEEATAACGIDPAGRWETGALIVDVDGDGWLDLYVCAYDAPNRLYRNRGGARFEECAARFGLDLALASVMPSFADYDRDGDLDLFLLTNRLYPPTAEDAPRWVTQDGRRALAPGSEESFSLQRRRSGDRVETHVAPAGQRDRLLRNDGGRFVDATEEAGLSGHHQGLSAVWWDHDDDGWPDLFVANDSWDPDQLWHNQGDGTFRDVAREAFPSTSWFSMGSGAADLDGDLRLDLLVADMSARTHFDAKLLMGDMGDSRWFLESAVPRQAMRNHLFLGTGTRHFLEAARLAGLASTDWTWSVELGDLDDDGRVDALFTNGSLNHLFDPDLVRELEALGADQERRGLDAAARAAEQWERYRRVPPRRERDVARRNAGELVFEDVSREWGLDALGVAYGAAQADLDRDGDLDLVVSQVEGPPLLYRNGGRGHALLVRLGGRDRNRSGVGARVEITAGGRRQARELQPSMGFLSGDEAFVHFGLGDARQVEELVVRWPSGARSVHGDLPADHLVVVHEPAEREPAPSRAAAPPRLVELPRERGLPTGARLERAYDDFAREPLLPMKLSRQGPSMAVGDADGDGDEDLFFGGSSGWPGRLFLARGDGSFEVELERPFAAERMAEDGPALWLDFDADGDLDLFVAGGGVECEAGDALLADRLYANQGELSFRRVGPEVLPPGGASVGAACAGDLDGDGDLDLFLGARSVPGRYGETPQSRLLTNEGGRFVDATASLAPLERAGMITSAVWCDLDGDARADLAVACDWGPVRVFHNAGGHLVEVSSAAGTAGTRGWWTSLAAADLDADGDLDLVAGNAGLATKYHADNEHPARLYRGVFDSSGVPQLIEAKEGEVELPVRGRSCSSDAMPELAQRFPDFKSFASAGLDEIYGREALAGALVLEAHQLASGVWWNEGGAPPRLRFEALPRRAQIAPTQGAAALDLDADGALDLAVAHNVYDREPETGRWNGGLGLVLRGAAGGALEPLPPGTSGWVVPGDARGVALTDPGAGDAPRLVVARNDARPLVFAEGGALARGRPLAVRLRGPAGNPTCVGARARVAWSGGKGGWLEVAAGGGVATQSSATLFLGRPAGTEGAALELRWPDGRATRHELLEDTTRIELDMPAPQRAGSASREDELLHGWPRFRGPLDTGEAPHADPPLRWSETENVRWKQPLPGLGHSTPVVLGERVFLTTAYPVGEAQPPRYDDAPGAHDGLPVTHHQRYEALALARDDGRVLWQRTLAEALPHEGGHDTGSYASASPATDGERLVVSFGSRGVFGLALDGTLLWERQLGERFDTKHAHGEGSSPLLHDGVVLVVMDHEGESFVEALDADTGETRWRAVRDEPTSWATPIALEHDGRQLAIVPGTKRLRAYDLDDGEVVWECGGLSHNVVASPVAADGLVIAGSSYEKQSMFALRLDGARGDLTGSDQVVWLRRKATPYVPSPLLVDGSLYFLHHYQGFLARVDAATGAESHRPLRLPAMANVYASPVAAAGRVYLVDLAGRTIVMRHGAPPVVLATNDLDESFSASPALAGRELYLRGEHALYCIAEDGE